MLLTKRLYKKSNKQTNRLDKNIQKFYKLHLPLNMPAERPISFPSEPLRVVDHKPQKATLNSQGHAEEKDGQLYFWDNVMQFPDTFRAPNKQMPLIPVPDLSYIKDYRENIDRVKQQKTQLTLHLVEHTLQTTSQNDEEKKLHWPEDDPLIGEGYYYPHKAEVPSHYIKRSKDYWRNAKRGWFSKVMELPRSGPAIHKRIEKALDLPHKDAPITTWSVLLDRQKNPISEFTYEIRYPEEITKAEDRKAWLTGITRLTEYATNYMTMEFLVKDATSPPGRILATAYAVFGNLLTYRIMLGGTFARMEMVEEQARANRKDYPKALKSALFEHDFTQINELIADTEEASGLRDINEMAMRIGHERHKTPDLEKWMGKLELNQTDKWLKGKLKNLVTSLAVGGVSRTPGVIELSAGPTGLLYAIPLSVAVSEIARLVSSDPEITSLLTDPAVSIKIIDAIARTIAASIAPAIALHVFTQSHENIHDISSNEKWAGIIPANVIRKETNPQLAAPESTND